MEWEALGGSAWSKSKSGEGDIGSVVAGCGGTWFLGSLRRNSLFSELAVLMFIESHCLSLAHLSQERRENECKVDSKSSAVGAKLKDKPLEGLEWWWSTGDSNRRDSYLEIIQAPKYLKYLIIYGYAGKGYPKWEEGQSIEKVRLRWLIRWKALKALPPLCSIRAKLELCMTP